MHFTGLPFDDIRALIEGLKPVEKASGDQLDHLAKMFRNVSGKKILLKPFCVLFYTANRAHNYNPAVTKAKLQAASDGSARVNKLCAHFDIGLKAFDLAIDHPLGVFSEQECAATIAYGMEALAGEPDLVILSSFAERANEPCSSLEELRQKGGRDVAALVGAIIAARIQNVPVIAEGLAAENAMRILMAINPHACDHVIKPQYELSDEGVSGVLTAGLLKAALSC
jgi:nicotinate-nucleotide--dimethylbenzimidazole phosphoribosyltransferase